MATCPPASGEPGQVGYGLGLLRRTLPGGVETIDHLGGAVGYWAYVARFTRQQTTVAVAFNAKPDDPSPLLLPMLEALAALPPVAATPEAGGQVATPPS